MFPDYSAATMIDLPVMGEAPPPSTTGSTVPTPSPSPAPAAPPSDVGIPLAVNGGTRRERERAVQELKRAPEGGVLKRWRRELLIALLVLLVSWASVKVLEE